MGDDTSVRVAVRIRPQLAREKIDNCRICTSVTPGEPQVVLGNDKAFTFDTVFDFNAGQQEVFEAHAAQLIEGCFDGYNATILAYGQTGSGKTHSMGTGFDVSVQQKDLGIIPRAVHHLFNGINDRQQNNKTASTFRVFAEFLELYNEDIYDLFESSSTDGKRQKSNIKIHEDSNGTICTQGVTLKLVSSYAETMDCLQSGALSRTTASTNMNSQSSRSHAIFTLHIKQTKTVPQNHMLGSTEGEKELDTQALEFETLSAKFNFVDLAGSERLKRTGATGDRAKEGISINCGLLALGNVISALGDVQKKGSHVPYRDSKLTRLLQDSLGGNSRTVMIACVSPSDRDFMETLNTLKYANRARNIKNKVVVNQDKTSKQLTELRTQLQTLQLELQEYKQGKRMVGPDGVESINDMFHENSLLQDENVKLRSRVKVLQDTVDSMKSCNEAAASDRTALILSSVSGENVDEEMKMLFTKFTSEIESLKVKLFESEAQVKQLKSSHNASSRLMISPSTPSMLDTSVSVMEEHAMSILELAKQDVERSKIALKSKMDHIGSMNESGISQSCNDSAEADSGEHEADDDLDDDQSDDSETLPEIEDSDQDSEDEQRDKEFTSVASTPEEAESEKLEVDLAEISSEISIKQKMIEELEKSQRQLQNIRQHYEDKLRNLQEQIKSVERERDQVLNSLGDKTKQSQEQVQKVKSEFEKRLSDMQSELKKVSAAKREHAKMMKNQAVYDKKIKELSCELNDMKKSKVKMMTRMKTESEKNKLSDQKKSKELLQLRKEKRLRENQLKTLQLQNRQKDVILKRKHEEVSQLRRKQREGSASSRVLAKNRVNSTQHSSGSSAKSMYNKPSESTFSPKVAKSKWDKLEHYISSVIMRKQTISSMEVEMDLFLTKREELSKKIEKYMKRLDVAIQHDDIEGATDLEDQLEAMNIKLNYLQSNVSDCQNEIMQMEEEAKVESVLSVVLSSMTLEEAKYLLEHLVSLTLTKGMDFTQKDIAFKELSARYEKLNMDSKLRDELLQQMLVESGVTLQNFHDFDGDDLNGEGSTSNSDRSSPLIGDHGDQMWSDRPREKSSRKARRRTATASDLLGTNAPEKKIASPLSSLPSGSPSGSKPAINIADIIPPAPKGPPPGRGMPPPSNSIETIKEEPEDQPDLDSKEIPSPRTQLLRSGSYTVLNSTTPNKPFINGTTTRQIMNGKDDLYAKDMEPERDTNSYRPLPYPDLDIESSKALSGSYTVVSGEITLDSDRFTTTDNLLTVTDSGEPGAENCISKSKKIPPKVPPKPVRPTSLNPTSSTISTASITLHSSHDGASIVNPAPISGSHSMTKWKGISSSNLDAADMDTSPKVVDKPPTNQSTTPVCSEPRDSSGRVIGRRKMAPSNASPSLRRKMFNSVNSNSNSSNKLVMTIQEVREPSSTPPSSPSLRRKQIMSTSLEGENVFMRLTNQTNTSQTINKRVNVPGTINHKSDRTANTNHGLVLVKQALGHTKPVISVCSTEDLLFTGSKDQTCKVWDLNIGCELMCLEDHPNYVTTVRYCANNKLVYSVSNSFIKVWDLRARGKCVKVLSSSGLVHESIPLEPASSSQAILQQGEQPIFDIWVGAGTDSNLIYSTTGSTVRVWDIRMFIATGKVASGHQAPIKCLTVNNTTSGSDLITGSKDHFIKLFDMSSDSSGVIQPRHTLSPPHYDGVECLVQRGNSLLSGSRDMSIKLWNLDSLTLQQTVNGAHRDWITDMCLLPDTDILISSCRGGIVKIWSMESCSQLDEIKAHSQSVHGLAASSSHLFTASSDNTVGIWRINTKLLS